MVDADYSQIEYRVLTALADNKELAELFKNPDSDYHTLMASLMFEVPYAAVTPSMRKQAKSFNFGIPYGMGPGSLAILLTGKNTKQTRDEAIEKTEAYYKNQPNTRKFFNNIKEMAQVNGYTKTMFNRYRYYSFTDKDGHVNNAKKAAALRQAGNAAIQGCLHGDTKILIKGIGITKIKNAVGYSGDIWNGKEWTHGDVLYSGEKQKCIITFDDNTEFICSPIHKFLVKDNPKDIKSYVECKDLKIGTEIICDTKSELSRDRHSIKVKSVEITDEYIDMYDVCNTDCGYYVADGIITHNTAADIFKISVARNFSYIKKNRLYGNFLIINMIHDEQLMEVNVQKLNIQRIVRDFRYNMQYELAGFPPLYIGAGVGLSWGFAKGGDAEMHPDLLQQLSDEADNMPIWRTDTSWVEPADVMNYFQDRIHEFSRQKIAKYLLDPKNQHTDMHPAIVSLLNDKFSYGRNENDYSTEELTRLNLLDFIKENNLQVDPDWYKYGNAEKHEEEEDKEYDEDEDEDDLEGIEEEKQYTMIDESDKLFGSSINDIIGTFGVCLLKNQRICGVDMRDAYYKTKDAVVDYLTAHACDSDDVDGLEVVFLVDGNILNRTGIKVKGIKASELESRYRYQNKKFVGVK